MSCYRCDDVIEDDAYCRVCFDKVGRELDEWARKCMKLEERLVEMSVAVLQAKRILRPEGE